MEAQAEQPPNQAMRRPALARLKAVWRAGKRSPQLLFGATVATIFITVGVFAPWIAPYHYDDQDIYNRLVPPIWAEGGQQQHLLGTDRLGRDNLSRLIYGTRISLMVGVLSVVLAGSVGVIIGVVAGYRGGLVDAISMRIADVQYAFPFILLAIFIVAIWGPGVTNTIIALGVGGWMTFARTARASTLSVKQADYIAASSALGASFFRVIFRHVLPNIMAPLLVLATFQVPGRILAEATLSFLGLGIRPPMPSWGVVLAENRGLLATQPWLVALPGLAIMLAALGVNQLGDGLRDLTDPRLRGKR